MVRPAPFAIIYPPWLKDHFQFCQARIQREIRDAIEEELWVQGEKVAP